MIAVRKDPSDAYAILGSGQRIDDPHALLPALEANSASAQAIDRADAAGTNQRLLSTGIAVAAGLGYATMLSALAFAPSGSAPASDEQIGAGVAVVTVGSVVALGSLAFLPLAISASVQEVKEKDTAFVAYDRGLRRTLNLPETTAIISNGDVFLEVPMSPDSGRPQAPTTPAPQAPTTPTTPTTPALQAPTTH